LAFGYASQRGRFCMLSAVYEIATGRSPDMMRAYLLAVLVQLLAVNALVQLGYLQVEILPFFGIATALGGVLFGLGMVLGIGCAGAVLYRLGEGKLDYLLVLFGYAAGAWASSNWLVMPVRNLLHVEGQTLSVPEAVVLGRWPVIAAVALCIGVWLLLGKARVHEGRWGWRLTGFAIGCIGVAAWVASDMAGRPAGLGTVNGSRSLMQFILRGDTSALDWGLFLFLGIPLGSLIASRWQGSSPGRPLQPYRVPQALGGGLLMGLGAALVEGDNVLHGIAGVPLLAMSSVTFMLCAFGTSWLGVKLGWLGK
jgi:uncharacterized membrane protein YedE/YeeE